MDIRRRTSDPPGKIGAARKAARPSAGQHCESLARVLARITREPHPEVLDLGPLCGDSVVYVAQRGAKVQVESFEPPPPVPPKRPGQAPPEVPPIRINQPDGKFHLILVWEHADFVPPERLKDFSQELRRMLRDGGWLLLFSHMRPESDRESPARYRLMADDRVVREQTKLPRRRRWTHSTREIERSLKGFSIQGVHLQRNQMREFLALKA